MASIQNTLYQKAAVATKQTTQQLAQAAAAQVKQTMEVAKAQVGVPQSEQQGEKPPQAVPEVVQTIRDEGVDSVDRASIARAEQARYKELEGLLAQIRAQEEQKKNQYLQSVDAQMQQTKAAPQQEYVAPQGKVRRVIGAVKQKAQSMISNRKQGETKAGSGKG